MLWYFQVGLPGKSSKAGTMMMVLPNTMGISIYSPNIDQYGNSVRGLAFCEELVKVFNFHRYIIINRLFKTRNNNTIAITFELGYIWPNDFVLRYDNSTRFVSKLNPRRVLYESKGDTIVSLMYAAAAGDLDNLRR